VSDIEGEGEGEGDGDGDDDDGGNVGTSGCGSMVLQDRRAGGVA
jgi:hypothetical protein